MKYEQFRKIFDKRLFYGSKRKLIENIAKSPEQYTGLFRPTKIKTKIIHNSIQSHEIRFGYAFEELIENYLKKEGYKSLPKKLNFNGKILELNQIAEKNNTVIFAEHKMRDNHDSTKKKGQFLNFEEKTKTLKSEYPNRTLKGYFYFIDPSFEKNKNYYNEELEKLRQQIPNVELSLVYGQEFFEKLGIIGVWEEIEKHLLKWQKGLPDIPNVDLDSNIASAFEELKTLSKNTWKNFFNEKVIQEIWPVLFPEGKALTQLKEYFKTKNEPEYRDFITKIEDYISST